jgi:hypothetical protein
VHAVGPVKGAKLVGKAVDYLCGVGSDEIAHFMVTEWRGRRSAVMMVATFSYGEHPDQRVDEEGLSIKLHVLKCGRSQSRCAAGIPVAFISRHALNRLYERGHDICENIHAVSVFARIGALGYLTHWSEPHAGGGLSLLFSDLLMVGASHRCTRTGNSGRVFNEVFFDVRTVLLADEAGAGAQAQLEQGRAAAAVVEEWYVAHDFDDIDEKSWAQRIPCLPRREDHYPLKVVGR